MSIPKVARRTRSRKPMRRVGSVGLRYLEIRQEFLRLILDGRDRAKVPCGMRVGMDGRPYADPDFAAVGDVEVWIDLNRPPQLAMVTSGHVHHDVARSRRPGWRCSLQNLVLVTIQQHAVIEGRYHKGGTGS